MKTRSYLRLLAIIIVTVEPRFNEPLFKEVLDITNEILRPGQSYSKMYGREPRYNEPRYNESRYNAAEDKR